MRLDPADQHVALEYAFLCYETKQQVMARRVFGRVKRKRKTRTAAQAFENIDRPLREGIARWQAGRSNFRRVILGAHEELARLAEQRDVKPHLPPSITNGPGDCVRTGVRCCSIWAACGPRCARRMPRCSQLREGARAARRRGKPANCWPARYPFVYEFHKALELDPNNVELRRELAYLHLEMKHRPEAEQQFEIVVEGAPDDLLSAAQLGFLRLTRGDRAGAEPLLQKVLAGADDELADRVRTALHLPPSAAPPTGGVARQGIDHRARARGEESGKGLSQKTH